MNDHCGVNACYGGITRPSSPGREAPVNQQTRALRCCLCASNKGWRVPVERNQRPGSDPREVCPETVSSGPERERSGRVPVAIGRRG